MWDFSIKRSLTLMGQTMPFILLRCSLFWHYAGLRSDDR